MTKRFVLLLAIVTSAGMVSVQSYPQSDPEQPNTAAAAPQDATNAPGQVAAGKEGEVSGGISGKQTAKDVGIAAGAGTVLGLLFGHAIRGLAIGAAAGGGYVLATQGKDVELPAQTGLKLRLDSNLAVPASGP